jgi:GxxExxY protein
VPLSLENELAHRIIGFAIEIHKAMGPGLPPDVYRKCLQFELSNANIDAEALKTMPIRYKTLELEAGFTIDILVDNKVVVIIETADTIAEFHVQKLLRFLRFGNYKLGLLINFNSTLLKDGIRRVTNNKLLEKEMENSEYSNMENI